MDKLIKPIQLNKGDTIGLISPSSPMAALVPHRTEKGISALKDLGFDVRIATFALDNEGHVSASGEKRAQSINELFADKQIKAIISFIGGNHSSQILKYLDFDLIKKNPKVILGFSDFTVLALAIHAKTNLVTFYGPAVLTQFAENPKPFEYTLEYFEKALMTPDKIGKIYPSTTWTDEVLDWFEKKDLERPRKMQDNNGWQWIKDGEATGPIMGGCITSIMHLRGTEYWPDFSGSILFWETPESSDDFTSGENPENIDSYLTDLELSGVFDSISGMIVGRPFGYAEDSEKKLIEIIENRTRKYTFPILYNVNIGHSDPMITVPIGVQAWINSKNNSFEILESGVASTS
ncbi:MAG: S66 peptidase family protein [Patescibacteria group bacterium]